MINILKPFEGLATRFWRNEFDSAVIKLTFYYVLSTAVILLVSSVAILTIFAPPEMEVPFRDETVKQIEIEHDDWSLYEVREHLASVVLIVDLFILFVVSILSYFFARRTLLPIKAIHEKQRQFLGDVAHELRTPLAVMQVGADTILRRERTATEYQQFVTDIQEEATRLSRVSNQLLQLLRAENVKTTTRVKVSISELLENELRRFTPYAVERGIILKANIVADAVVSTQKDELVEIVQNLLKNAIDYSDPGDEVNLVLQADKTHVTFVVADTGIGISDEHQTLVFDRFQKVDRARTQVNGSGTGLGLSIVKTLVTKLGGNITLKSKIGVGTEVTVTLPKIHS